jgi:hypothetical protein
MTAHALIDNDDAQMSEGPQTFDIAVTSLTYYGTTQPPASLYKFYYPGRDVTTASWRTSANTRIDNIRKGDLNVKVVDANNNPITGTLTTITITLIVVQY